MIRLVVHDGVIFEDDTVYTTGHSYTNCTFRRCTIVIRDGVGRLGRNEFIDCVWHFDYVVSGSEQARLLIELLVDLERTFPKVDAVAPTPADTEE